MKTWLISIMFCVVAVVLVAMLVPVLKSAKEGGGPPCILNLRLIQVAKEMHAEEIHITNDVVFTKEQLLPYGLGGKWRQCPKGGQYSIGSLHESPRCSYHTNLVAKPK